jgi:hypothetical protein
MPTLSRENRRLLENTVAQARAIAEEGARKVLRDQYAVHHDEPWTHMKDADGDSPEMCRKKDAARKLRNQLRAHGRQLGDKRDPKLKTQQIEHLVQACAYEHWHRMLFARFLAENDLLLDAENNVAMTLDEVRELARELGRDWMDVAAELAQRMLLRVFSPDDPVLKVQLPPETRQQLEQKLASLPKEVFQADDSLGWVYQFWQRDAKERVDAEVASGAKADADRIPPKTQFFTEDYMVLFLLENTLGAWWTAKRRAEGKDATLSGYSWTYLRLNEDGSPVAGPVADWPRLARDLRVLDPCMGSGHFLVFALPVLACMRMDEEHFSLKEALAAVLRENLYGLEIDARCSQIAAFNLALAAWRLAGEHFELPEMNLACSGLGIHASEADWVRLAAGEYVADQWMRRLYSLFRDAPTLGSLIDPTRYLEKGQDVGFERVLPLIEEALQREQSDEGHELAIAAQGVLGAFRILANRFTLVATNVPYLGRGKQDSILAEFCEDFYTDAKADLATCFVDRCLRFCHKGGTAALVTPQNWLFLTRYKKLRERLLKSEQWDFVARLGEHAFDSPAAAGAFAALVGLTHQTPAPDQSFPGWDVVSAKTPDEKAEGLRGEFAIARQADQAADPNAVISFHQRHALPLLKHYAGSFQGLCTSDDPQFVFDFWELPAISPAWRWMQSAAEASGLVGGCSSVLLWEEGKGRYFHHAQALKAEGRLGGWKSGKEAWSKRGMAVNVTRHLFVNLYLGEYFDNTIAAIIPADEQHLDAIYACLSSAEYVRHVKGRDGSLSITELSLLNVPFDLAHWQQVATEHFPNGLPKPHSDDPTQWLFSGHPTRSDHPLQVAVARLLGYRWPRQTGSTFPECPALGLDGLEKHSDADGIVPLIAAGGEAAAADRLRALLADAYGSDWSAAKLQQLIRDWNSIEEWLRDGFFEEHCRIFHQRPFIWHVWDGRRDGFHALVNYHKLAAPNGEGRQTLEKLIYTYLGRWIERQTDELRAGKDGADARFTAATHLKAELEKILAGEKPYDIFNRWKPFHEQPVGWEPEISDGVRMNIRPWVTAKVHQPSRRDGCILRVTPRIPYGKDRGKEPHRPIEDFPWFWTWDGQTDDFMGGEKFDGTRWNDLHYSLAKKKEARKRQTSAVVSGAGKQ